LPSANHVSKPFGYLHELPRVQATLAVALPATSVAPELRVDSPLARKWV
jgi:hypothetical protein